MAIDIRKTALRTMIASVLVTALIGILAVLTGSDDPVTIKVLVTAFSVSAASLGALACATFLERHPRSPLAIAGIGLSICAGALVIAGIWSDVDAEGYWKTTASIAVAAIATAHFSLLSLARLGPRVRWVRLAAAAVIFGLAAMIIYMIFGEPRSEWYERVLTVLSILVAVVTLVIPVLHKLGAGAEAAAAGLDAAEISITCPDCSAPQSIALGESTCPQCGCRFSVAVVHHGAAVAAPARV